MTGSRPRHQDKDLEQLLQELEAAGWRVIKGKKYFKAYCPKSCGEHLQTVHLTPMKNYHKRLRAHLERSTCWGGTG